MSPKRLATRRFWVRHRGAIGYLIIVFVVFYLYHSQQDTNADSRAVAVKAARLARANQKLVRRIQHAAKLGVRTHTGVCRLKDDLETRVANSEAFLRDHPDGIPGISAKTIQLGVDGQKRTIRSLRVIGPCPP
jgi:hypothetical protein